MTNTAPVFPCRTPGNICKGVTPETNGVPCPYLVGPACQPVPSAPPCPVVGISPAPTLGTSIVIGPITTPKPVKGGDTVASPGKLGTCSDYGKYGCVGKQPAVCDVAPIGSGHSEPEGMLNLLMSRLACDKSTLCRAVCDAGQ